MIVEIANMYDNEILRSPTSISNAILIGVINVLLNTHDLIADVVLCFEREGRLGRVTAARPSAHPPARHLNSRPPGRFWFELFEHVLFQILRISATIG